MRSPGASSAPDAASGVGWRASRPAMANRRRRSRLGSQRRAFPIRTRICVQASSSQPARRSRTRPGSGRTPSAAGSAARRPSRSGCGPRTWRAAGGAAPGRRAARAWCRWRSRDLEVSQARNSCVPPPESARISTFRRSRRGSWAIASRGASMWSAAVFEPALPGRGTMTTGSPFPASPWSVQAVMGDGRRSSSRSERPVPSPGECAVTMVASRSMVTRPPPAPGAASPQTPRPAPALPPARPRSPPALAARPRPGC